MAIREGSVFKRCSCRDDTTGKPLGTRCPKLKRPNGGWNSAHGTWAFQIELPRRASGARRQARRIGFDTQEAARDHLDHIKAALAVAEGDEQAAIKVADLIEAAIAKRTDLPGTDEVRRRIGGGADTREQVPTVGEWLTEWLAGKKKLAASTRLSYQGHITNYLAPHLGWVRLDKLGVGHLQMMFEAIEETNDHIRTSRASDDREVRASVHGMRTVSVSTKHRIRATLRSALSAAVSRPDLPLQVNVASHIELESAPRPKPVVWSAERVARYRKTGEVPAPVMVWTPEQTTRFLERAYRDRLYALFHLIALKGPRRGEAVGLEWDSVRLDDGAIDITTQVVQLGWDTAMSAPKSAAGRRTVTLDTDTVKVLKAWRKRQRQERLKAGESWTESGRVFTHPDGTGLHPGWVSGLFGRIAAEAGLPPISLHGLRHGAASLSLAAGVDVKVVSAELGHTTTAFTQDTYQSVFPDVAKAAAEATAKLLPLKQTGAGG
ncbi:tyrosine-type recombinase/integrase [Streptomonospora litoralis]|uniref:Site-specific tyrosine recombinase XerC n=1 Tax=Streptomonospora litoralis TaxID=2498135 RepID=A0A4P6Q8E8_9ACTN|nr:site-specific integrase [Streptomonospora litoralis]QBI55489.1 site-specific tyrosine recombinase XerC [Streptomonospora litoralis]